MPWSCWEEAWIGALRASPSRADWGDREAPLLVTVAESQYREEREGHSPGAGK